MPLFVGKDGNSFKRYTNKLQGDDRSVWDPLFNW